MIETLFQHGYKVRERYMGAARFFHDSETPLDQGGGKCRISARSLHFSPHREGSLCSGLYQNERNICSSYAKLAFNPLGTCLGLQISATGSACALFGLT